MISHYKKRYLHRGYGFTLIELLVVIAIIGLLVGIVTPSLMKATMLGKRTACISNLHGVAVGLRMYLDQSNEVMPYAAQMPSLGLNTLPRIVDVLKDWIERPEAMKCPADTDKKFYETEGSSYEYHTMHSGRQVGKGFLTRHFSEAQIPVMNDYEPFHGEPGQHGAANYLFADCHVGDLVDHDVEVEMDNASNSD